MKREIEIKLALTESPRDARRRLESLRVELELDRAFEDNVLYDDGSYSLAREGRLLRLRRTESTPPSALLTYKERVDTPQGRYKVRGEVDVSIDDPDGLDRILRRLGFLAVYRYQKYRTLFRSGDVLVCLDETPIGNYFELEGEPDAIDALAKSLGHSPADYVNLSYRELQERALSATGEEPGDMVFEERCAE